MSYNQVDIVIYIEVECDIDLDELCEDAYEADNEWPYAYEYECKGDFLSLTLATVDESFVSEVFDLVSQEEIEKDLQPLGIKVRRTKHAIVAWYGGADRPFPGDLEK